MLEAALDLLRERGLAKLTMSALAQRAGISRPTLYHLFPDVNAVLAAWVGREIENSVADLAEQARLIADPVQRLAFLVEWQARTFASQDHRLSAEHLETETGSPGLRGVVEQKMAPLRELIAETVGQAVADGALRDGIDPALAADLVLGLLGAIRRRLVAGTAEPGAAAAAVMDLLLSGWRRPPGR